MLWLGLGMLPKLAIVAMMVFFPVVITAAEGFSSVDRNLLDLMRSVSASPWEIFRRVRFPHALPQIFSGLKIGITLAVVGAVVGEWIGADNGLGYLLLQANTQLDSTLLFSALCTARRPRRRPLHARRARRAPAAALADIHRRRPARRLTSR